MPRPARCRPPSLRPFVCPRCWRRRTLWARKLAMYSSSWTACMRGQELAHGDFALFGEQACARSWGRWMVSASTSLNGVAATLASLPVPACVARNRGRDVLWPHQLHSLAARGHLW